MQTSANIDRPIVGLGPHMGIGASVDQLRDDPDLPAAPLYAAFQDLNYAQFLCDLAQVACRHILVLRYKRAADYFQVCNFGEVGKNLILHPVGEKGVRLILA